MESMGVVGMGLVGGSFAKALRGKYSLFVWDQDEETRRLARDEGYAVLEPELLGARCQATFLALPVGETASVARSLLRAGAPLVFSAASAQAHIFDDLESDPRYWGAHPLTGDTKAGWEASSKNLLPGAPWALLSRGGRVEDFFFIMKVLQALGSGAVPALPENHDKAMALTSHAVQVMHSALAALLADQSPLYHRLSGPALRDSTRLAESPLSMWKDILLSNRDNIDSSLEKIGEEVRVAKDSLDDPRALWRHASYGRDSLTRYRWSDSSWRTRSVPLQDWWQGLLAIGERGALVKEPRKAGPLLYFQSSV